MLVETLFKSFKNNNTKWEKRDKNKNTNGRKRIGNNISDIQFVITKWKTIKNNTKKRRQRIEIECLRTAFHGGNL